MDDRGHSTRRDFLQGRSAAERLRDAIDGDPAASRPPEVQQTPLSAPEESTGYLVHFGRAAMACQFELYLNAGQYPKGTEAALEVLDLVDALEDQMSVYRATSELSQINATAADEAVEVEPGLFELLRQSLAIHTDTAGAFDITSGPLSKAWGFFRRAGAMPTAEEIAAAHARVGSQHVELDAAQRTIRFLKPDVEINVNSIGKGYALDRCGELLRRWGIDDFLFHGGQSSVLAGGSSGGSVTGGWNVGLVHPLRPDRRLAEFFLRDRALGTSGSATQFFHYQGKRYGHVLDPRTGRPAEGVYSATAIAPTAAEADALATAFYVLGPEKSLDYCRTRPELAAVLVCPAAGAGSIALHQIGLTDQDWRVLEQHQAG